MTVISAPAASCRKNPATAHVYLLPIVRELVTQTAAPRHPPR